MHDILGESDSALLRIKLQRDDFDGETDVLELADIRERVLNRMLLLISLFGGLVIVVIAGIDILNENYFVASIYIVFFSLYLSILLLKQIPYFTRCSISFLLLYLLGTHEAGNWGHGSAAPSIYLGLIVFSSILLGTRYAAGGIVVCVLTLTIAGIYHASIDSANQPDISLWIRFQKDWLNEILTLALFSTFAVSSLKLLLSGLDNNVRTTRRVMRELHLERNRLSEMIEERDRVEEQFRHSQKMEAVGQLAGGVAHDFNNLLQAILGYGELALDKSEGDLSNHTDIEQMMVAGERARVLVRQLLAFSRRQILELDQLDVSEIVNDLLQMIERVIGAHISLKMVLSEDLIRIRADRGQIEQVVVNLCVNARDAMLDGGTLTIETSNVELDSEFCSANAWATPGKYVLLKVSDTGIGIEVDLQERVFEPFFTTKEQGKGTGLGLSTVFGIIRQHNGFLNLESKSGAGSTFNIYLSSAGDDEVKEDIQELNG